MSVAVAQGDATASSVDEGIELVRKIPLGAGVAPSTRMFLAPLEAAYAPFLALHLREPVGPSFIVVEPGMLFDDYVVEIPEDDVEILGIARAADVAIFVIVTPGASPTVNLSAPIVVNRRTRRAAQVILEDSGYGHAVPISKRRLR